MTVRTGIDQRGVGAVVVDREAKLNALDTPTLEALAAGVAELGQNPNLRAIVLRGAGTRAFIGGADIGEMSRLSGPDAARAFITRVHRACDAMRRAPVPVIARIQGHALGAGLEIAASCDMRIASRNAAFGMPEVRIGLPSVVEAALLPGLIGWGRTRRLLLTGETITAGQALGWGLIERAVETEQLDDAVEAVLASILASGPNAVRLQKQLIADWEGLPLREAVQRGIDVFAEAWKGPEPARLTAAFLEAQRRRKASG